MPRYLCCLVLTLALSLPAEAADLPKDTNPAAHTRNKKLKGKVTVDFKMIPLKEALTEISGQLEDQKLGALAVHFALGVSQNTKISYSAKDVTAEVALDGILKQLSLGYHVVSKDKDRYDGWIEIAMGSHRGYPPGVEVAKKPDEPVKKPDEPKPEPKKPDEPKTTEPKKPDEPKTTEPADPDEKNAQLRLDTAKKLLEDGKADEAKILLKYVVRNLKTTKAAEEAKQLLEKIK